MPINSEIGETKSLEVNIAFSEKDAANIHPHNDDPVVIAVRCNDLEIRRVLVYE